MHGIIFKEMQRYVTKHYGLAAWYELLKAVGLDGKLYLPTQNYPDEEMKALVGAIGQHSGRTAEAVLEEFGEALVPNLLQVYGSMIQPHWKTLDLLEHTENTMHRAVRFNDRLAAPPQLICTRLNARTVQIHYASPRKMSNLGIGIIRGIARHFGENITLETVHQRDADGRDHCLITVRTRG